MYPQPLRLAWHCVRNKARKIAPSPSVILSMRVRILLSPRARIQRLTSGIRATLSCNLSISCSIPSPASLPAPQQPPVQTSSCLSEATLSPRSSSPVARHVRRTVSALGRLEHAAAAGSRTRCGRGTRASGGGKGVKAGSGGAGSSQSGGGSSGGGRCSACCSSGGRGSTRQQQQLHLC